MDCGEAPDGGWGWIITGATFTNNIITGGIGYTFGLFLPHLIETFEETRFVLAWITSIQGGTSLLTGKFVAG